MAALALAVSPGIASARVPPGAEEAARMLERDPYDAVTIAAVANDEDTLRALLAEDASAELITSRMMALH